MFIMVVIVQIDDDTVDDNNSDDTAVHTFLVNTRVLIQL